MKLLLMASSMLAAHASTAADLTDPGPEPLPPGRAPPRAGRRRQLARVDPSPSAPAAGRRCRRQLFLLLLATAFLLSAAAAVAWPEPAPWRFRRPPPLRTALLASYLSSPRGPCN